jgi:hypothetical protein
MNDFLFFIPMLIACASPIFWIVLYYRTRKFKPLLLVYRINLVIYFILIGVTLLLVATMAINTFGLFVGLAYGCMLITAHLIIAWIGFPIWRRRIERNANG